MGRLAKAQLEVCYYEGMLRLEERKADLAVRSFGPGDVECEALAAQIRVLKLQEEAQRLRDAVGGSGEEKEEGGEEEDGCVSEELLEERMEMERDHVDRSGR